jgi:hypothetical protein
VLASASDDHSVRIWCTAARHRLLVASQGAASEALGVERKEEEAVPQQPPERQLDIHHRMFLGNSSCSGNETGNRLRQL